MNALNSRRTYAVLASSAQSQVDLRLKTYSYMQDGSPRGWQVRRPISETRYLNPVEQTGAVTTQTRYHATLLQLQRRRRMGAYQRQLLAWL